MRVILDLSENDIRLVTRLLRGRSYYLRLRARSAVAPRIFQPSLQARTIKAKEAIQRKKTNKLKREAGTLRRIAKAFDKYIDEK